MPLGSERTSVPEQVFERLMEDLLSGRYAPGERLPTQRRLAEDFRVNLGSVREALKRLEQLKLVDVRHGEAMRVRDWRADGGLEVLAQAVLLDGGQLGAILEARRTLLAEAARLAAERRSDAAADRLGAIATQLVAGEQDARALDWAFWAEIVEAADNLVFRLITNTIRDVYFAHAARFDGLVEADAGYGDVARAIADRDADAAGKAAQALALRQEQRLR
jgi:GntR family transcriptional repressor for pyruvate dehydrogenase complex